MALVGVDMQLFVQTLLYFAGCLSGFVTAVCVGATMVNFGGNCILYGEVSWKNASFSTYSFGSKTSCNFPLYVSVFGCVIYGAAMGSYYTYAICKSRKDPSIGSQMWVMPFIMANSLVTVVLFIISCVISVGFVEWCNSFVDGAKEKGALYIKSCVDGEKHINWNYNSDHNYAGNSYFEFLTVAQTASWITFLIWGIQSLFCCLRLYRNRRRRGAPSDGNVQVDVTDAKDTDNVYTVNPTA